LYGQQGAAAKEEEVIADDRVELRKMTTLRSANPDYILSIPRSDFE
jgi:hypothetical protein